MSFGDKWSEIDLDSDGLTVALGKNGHGKSTVLDALCFVITGRPVRQAAIGKMVNNTNAKGLEVDLNFTIDDQSYRIVRGQKPGFCRFWRGDEELTLSSSKETSQAIQEVIGLTHDTFRIIVVNSTRVPQFFQMDAAGQKKVMETLFGFDVLTKKADNIKILRSETKIDLEKERTRFEERAESRQRAIARSEEVRKKFEEWDDNQSSKIAEAKEKLTTYQAIDLEKQLVLIKQLEDLQIRYGTTELNLQTLTSEHNSKVTEYNKLEREVAETKVKIEELEQLDIDALRKAYTQIAVWGDEATKHREAIAEFKRDVSEAEKEIERLKKEMKSVEEDDCPTCGQQWPDHDMREETRIRIKDEIDELERLVSQSRTNLEEERSLLEKILDQIEKTRPDVPEDRITATDTEIQIRHKELSDRERAKKDLQPHLDLIKGKIRAVEEKLERIETEAEDLEEPLYDSEADVREVRSRMSHIEEDIKRMEAEENPYITILADLESEIGEEPDEAIIKEKEILLETEDYLAMTLTKKDSPIRRAVVGRYLPILNQRMGHYLVRLEIPYSVEFTDFLEISVWDGEREIDPSALSGGEEERVSLALSWAFRDVYEEVTGRRISFSAVDERLDSGLDGVGAEAAVNVLHEMALEKGRSVWLVTHRKDLEDFADRVVRSVKDGRYSHLEVEA